jgi:hypothetical protein
MKKERQERFYRFGVVAVARRFPEKKRVIAIRKIRLAITEFEDMGLRGVYNSKGMLKPSIEIGRHWEQENQQRRKIVDTLPRRPPGRPAKPEHDLLMSRLSCIYLEATGQMPTFDGGDKSTPFESFLKPIFTALGLSGMKSAIRKHRKSVARAA